MQVNNTVDVMFGVYSDRLDGMLLKTDHKGLTYRDTDFGSITKARLYITKDGAKKMADLLEPEFQTRVVGVDLMAAI